MPEGPEIRRSADEVDACISKKKAKAVFFGLERLKSWEPKLTGLRVRKVEARGKAMLIRFSQGPTIYSHNQLYGRWFCCPAGKAPQTKRQLRLAIHTGNHSALLYSASDIEVLSDGALQSHPFLSKLGPDVLDNATTIELVSQRLVSRSFYNRQLGAVLMDQSFVAGLGNYLRCEILFESGLHPRCHTRGLGAHQIEKLAQVIIALPRQSYQTGGITNDLERAENLMSLGANFEAARFLVFRRGSKPCYHCKQPIMRESHGGNTYYFCPNCQAGR